MIEIILALWGSLGNSIGGKAGALIGQLVGAFGTFKADRDAWIATVGPWITWSNAIVDAKRDPSAAEDAAANAVADAAHADLQSKAKGGPGVPIPPPPT
jgi:hypothetical protein